MPNGLLLHSSKDLAVSPFDFAQGKPQLISKIRPTSPPVDGFTGRPQPLGFGRLCSHLSDYSGWELPPTLFRGRSSAPLRASEPLPLSARSWLSVRTFLQVPTGTRRLPHLLWHSYYIPIHRSCQARLPLHLAASRWPVFEQENVFLRRR